MLDLGVVIVNWNVRDLLLECLDSVYLELAQSRLRGVVVVVDNDSRDGSAEAVSAQFPRTRLICSANDGMGAGNNRGLAGLGLGRNPEPVAEPAFAALILNPDTRLHAGALQHLLTVLRTQPAAAVVAPKLLNPDGSLQHAGFRFPGLTQAALDLFPLPGRLAWLHDSPINGRYPAGWYAGRIPFQVDHSLGAAFLVRAVALHGQDLFDEAFGMYCEEIDAHWRLSRQGWQVWVAPAAEVTHLGGQSTRQAPGRSFIQLWTSRLRLYQRYHTSALVAAVGALVRAAMRRRMRANRASLEQGGLDSTACERDNAVLAEVLARWSRAALARPG